jgi:hypothetical protein
MSLDAFAGAISGERVKLDGDISSVLHITIPLKQEKTMMEDWLATETLEKTVSSIIDFGYTNSLEMAASIVAAKHPSDRL